METVIEIVEPDRRAPSLFRFVESEITIGRAWSADLVISDEEIDPLHLRIRFEEEADNFVVEDLNSTNGVSLSGRARITHSSKVSFGELITLGQTRIRVHRKHDPVAPTKLQSKLENLLNALKTPLISISLALIAVVLFEFNGYLQSTNAFKWQNELSQALRTGAALLAWAVIWGMIAKVVKHQSNIWAHLGLASVLILLGVLLDWIRTFIAFNTLSASISSFLQMMNVWIAVFLWVSVALIITTKLKFRARLSTAIGIVSLSILTTYLLPKFGKDQSVFVIPLQGQSLPSSFLVARPKSSDHFENMIFASLKNATDSAKKLKEKRDEKSN